METWQEAEKRLKAEAKKIDDELHTLLCHFTVEELENRFFKNFGCINFKDDEYMHEVKLARVFHAWHKNANPEKHDEHEVIPYNCYHQTVCKCGYSEAYDSGD